jgi:hypothetical protein
MPKHAQSLEPAHAPQTLNLAAGSQAVINGALITAHQACSIDVGSGAYVFSGRTLWRDDLRNPHEELYFSILEASRDADRFAEEQFRLFALLSQVVTQDRSHEAQKECALCASALLTGKREDATRSAARLASLRLDRKGGRQRGLPGRQAEKREAIAPVLKEPL